MKKIPNKLKEYRLRMGLAQVDVANHLGFRSTDRISRWEAGLTYPHVVNLKKLAKLFKVSMEELYPDIIETDIEDDSERPSLGVSSL